MVAVATLFTREQGLLGTIGFRHMPAFWAGLRSVAWVDRHHLTPSPCLLVFQHAAEYSPALIQDGFIQPCFGRDMASWFLGRSPRRLRHVLHLQILDNDHRVVFAGLSRELVQKVMPA